jgi:hypothetical protein
LHQEDVEDEIQARIDVDLLSAESYIVWKHKVAPLGVEPYDILEYTWLKCVSTGGWHLEDGTGWGKNPSENHPYGEADSIYADPVYFPYKFRVSQIGKKADHSGTYGEWWAGGNRQKMWPVISYNSQSSKWDKLQRTGDDHAYSTIMWSEKTEDGWGIYYTHVLPNGRELLPDGDFTDKKLEGEAVLSESTYAKAAPALDSGFESVSTVYDSTGNVKVVWGEQNNKLYYTSSSEVWATDNNLVTGTRPDVAVDSNGNYHAVWEVVDPGTGKKEVRYASWDGETNIQRFAPKQVSTWGDNTASIMPRIVYANHGAQADGIHIFWVENKNVNMNGHDEVYYRKYDINGNSLIGPLRAAFFPAARPGVTWFGIVSLDLAFDEEVLKIGGFETRHVHVVYGAEYRLPWVGIMKEAYHASVDLNNIQYHPEAAVTPGLFIVDDVTTAAVDIGPDSVPFVVFTGDDDVFFQRLNRNPAVARRDGAAIKINDQGEYNRVSWNPNIVVDRDTVRLADSKVDWDEPEDNDRFLHVAFYTRHTSGSGKTVVELHYTKLDRSGNIMVSEKPVLAMSTDGATNLIPVDFPDMEMDRDNRIGLVATGHTVPMSWSYYPIAHATYYLKLDNNGEVLSGPSMLNAFTLLYDVWTIKDTRWPMVVLNSDDEAHVVFSVYDTEISDYIVFHTRHYLL